MPVRRQLMGEMLQEMGAVTAEQLAAALEEQQESGEKLGRILVSRGVLTEQRLMETLELITGIPRVQISKIYIDPEVVKIISPDLIRMHKALPILKSNNSLTLAMSDPTNQQAINDVRMASGFDVIPVLASEKELDIAIRQFLAFSPDPGVEKILEDLNQEYQNSVTVKKNLPSIKIDQNAPVIRIVNAILRQAVQGRSSDIHIEPREEDARVRFRIDGELYEVFTLPDFVLSALVSRLKIMAGMDIAEKRIPQDGSFHLQIEKRDIDFRVSTLPTNYGEKIVLRILDRANSLTRIDQLGLSPGNQEKLISLSRRPHGIILVTGPTGSGKTTSLYSVLNEINSVDKNIITLEDPIEYSLAGINQVQINPKAGLTFASGLRSILRQDPDIIMVGEIRDKETAGLAVQAALTGHLVLSTLHTNSAAGTIARLSNIGIENFLLAAALAGVISQRLVRKICPNCAQPYKLAEENAIRLGIPEETNQEFFHATGCNMCRQLGYLGRIALHEIMVAGPEIRTLISRGENLEDFYENVAVSAGMITIKNDGVMKARRGITSLEEVMKAIRMY